MKHVVERNFIKERVELGFGFQRVRVYDGRGKADKMVTRGWNSRWEFTSPTASRQRARWEWLMSFETSKPSPSDISSNKVTPPNPSQIVPSTKNQVFKIWTSGDQFHSDHDSWPRQCAPLEALGDMAPLLSTLQVYVGQWALVDLVWSGLVTRFLNSVLRFRISCCLKVRISFWATTGQLVVTTCYFRKTRSWLLEAKDALRKKR